ncbi:MAG: hypothetical protein A9Z00_04350 [Thermobacillus sp. ZCTH02-B1]|uniref:hypothetical protein n=1 Tax=Thermobacillus sp. ZCTH02-B1 TaxID=1858795 RepID=UPI000B5791EF|nr:hypothetical protein [Thermobacillus sp. ZCTH02-B1]OUM96815.1 MAG: hypothetical protein A9Z00_04350 [Thermobacillus sp. ZCTH02-B1]
MEKRLPRTELLFSLVFVFTLAVAVAAFFLGMKIGVEQTEARYAPKLEAADRPAVTDYQQQDLLSYYYTVYQPFRSFAAEWVREASKMKTGQTANPSGRLKAMADAADERYREARASDMPANAPLLVDAQTNVLKSLKLFSKTFSRYAGESGTAQDIIRRIGADELYREALDYALLAERQYYEAMVLWGASLDPDFPNRIPDGSGLPVEIWKSQPLLVKNAVAAGYLREHRMLRDYHPHDLTARVDYFFESGQANGFKIGTVDEAVDILLRTDAVRSGDFLERRASYGEGELLPQLPMFGG